MSACKGCGKEIIWGTLPDGGAVPLDPRAPVYRVRKVAVGICADKVEHGGPAPDYMVSHFATCPQANRFSGSKSTAGTGKKVWCVPCQVAVGLNDVAHLAHEKDPLPATLGGENG